MPSKFKNDLEHVKWLGTNRTHEECSGCTFEYIMPAPCPGHAAGETACQFKQKMEKVIAYYEDGIPVDHNGCYIFPKAKDLPKTHFPTSDNDPWVLVRSCPLLHLPEVGAEILFVKDVRGTQDEYVRNMMAKLGRGEPHPDQEVIHGYVTAIGFSEELQESWITACRWFAPDGGPIGSVNADHITYWKYLELPPQDTYVRSPYNYHQVFDIVQKASIELSKEKSSEK